MPAVSNLNHLNYRLELRGMSLSLTWVVAPSMSPSWLLKMASLRSSPLQATHTWEEKTLITAWSTTSSLSSSASTRKTSATARGRCVACARPARGPSVLCRPALRPASKSTLCMRELISTPPSPGHALRSWTQTCSEEPWSLWRRPSETPRWTNLKFTTLSWWEVPLVSLRSRSCCRTSSMERNSIKASTLMRQWPTVQV